MVTAKSLRVSVVGDKLSSPCLSRIVTLCDFLKYSDEYVVHPSDPMMVQSLLIPPLIQLDLL